MKTYYSKLSLVLPALTLLTACTTGVVKDSSSTALPAVDVIAYGTCAGAGCAASTVTTAVPAGVLTGYQVTTNTDGQYFYDPYAEMVPAEQAMAVVAPAGAENATYQLQMKKVGYQEVWLDHKPVFTKHTYEGKDYLISGVANVYLCRSDEPDFDGDGICDAAEAKYGTSAQSTDTDNDGLYDDQELFGKGSPLEVNTRALLHFNINVSNFAVSKAFYELLGARTLLEVDVDVSDPAEAQGLDLPPYQLHAAPMAFSDGFIIDLIQFSSPFNPEAPHASASAGLGFTTFRLTTQNLVADMAKLAAAGFSYVVHNDQNGNPASITLTDPDGLPVEVTQSGAVNQTANYAHQVSDTYITVSDYERSLAFYKKIGFRVTSYGNLPAVQLENGRKLALVAGNPGAQAYADVNHIGIARLAVKTTNIEQDIKVLEAAGVEFYSSPILPSGPFAFLRYVCFEDPDGTVIELVEYVN